MPPFSSDDYHKLLQKIAVHEPFVCFGCVMVFDSLQFHIFCSKHKRTSLLFVNNVSSLQTEQCIVPSCSLYKSQSRRSPALSFVNVTVRVYHCYNNKRNHFLPLCYVVLSDFGDAEVEELLKHFVPQLVSSVLDVDKIPDKWTSLKNQVYQEDRMSTTDWAEVNRRAGHLYPDVLAPIDLLLSIPSSTAVCEASAS